MHPSNFFSSFQQNLSSTFGERTKDSIYVHLPVLKPNIFYRCLFLYISIFLPFFLSFLSFLSFFLSSSLFLLLSDYWLFLEINTTVDIRLPDMSCNWMVITCPMVEWSINWMPFGYQRKSPVTERSCDKSDQSFTARYFVYT